MCEVDGWISASRNSGVHARESLCCRIGYDATRDVRDDEAGDAIASPLFEHLIARKVTFDTNPSMCFKASPLQNFTLTFHSDSLHSRGLT